jgi:hypothetical protein
MLVLFVIAAVWILGIAVACALAVASRKLDTEVALDRQLASPVSARDLAV